MRRLMLITLLAAVVAPFCAAASEPTPRAIVMRYECQQIDPKLTGFSCRMESDGMYLRWHEKTSEMNESRKERALYEFNKIALRYLDLGGKQFEVAHDHWAANKKRICNRPKNWSDNSYTCSDCTVQQLGGGGSVCK
jgi:hypothetical protein